MPLLGIDNEQKLQNVSDIDWVYGAPVGKPRQVRNEMVFRRYNGCPESATSIASTHRLVCLSKRFACACNLSQTSALRCGLNGKTKHVLLFPIQNVTVLHCCLYGNRRKNRHACPFHHGLAPKRRRQYYHLKPFHTLGIRSSRS